MDFGGWGYGGVSFGLNRHGVGYRWDQSPLTEHDRFMYCKQIEATAGDQPSLLVGKLVGTNKKHPKVLDLLDNLAEAQGFEPWMHVLAHILP